MSKQRLKVPCELLTAFDRPVRIPLPMQLKALASSTPPGGPENQENVEAWAKAFNQLALIELHFGRIERAAALCKWQIDWVADHVVPALGRGYAFFAFQPWINLARLDLRTGKREGGIAKLKVLRNALSRNDVTFRNVSITRYHYEAMHALEPKLATFFGNVYLTELLQLAVRECDCKVLSMALAVVEECGWVVDTPAITEAQIILGVADEKACAAALDPITADPPRGDYLVRIALRLRALVSDECATSDLVEIAEAALRLCELAPSSLSLAILQHAVGHAYDTSDKQMLDICEKGLIAAFALNDVLLIQWFHTASNNGLCDEEIAEKLFSESWYRALTKKDTKPKAEHAARLDAFTRELQNRSMCGELRGI